MFDSSQDRGPSSALRGWLSDIYFPALLEVTMPDRAVEALAARLGAHATVDDPLLGRAAGAPAVPEHLKKTAAWLHARGATFTRLAFTTGVDRDVTEGVIALTVDGNTADLPVAVIAERRRAREVELRVYYATERVRGAHAPRGPLVGEDTSVVLPQVVADHMTALHSGDAAGALACFEEEGHVRDAKGTVFSKHDGGLGQRYAGLFVGGPMAMRHGGWADDGRICAIEYTLTKLHGKDVAPQAGLLMYERGDSGLVKALRLYDDVVI
jgi:hypothetical protein